MGKPITEEDGDDEIENEDDDGSSDAELSQDEDDVKEMKEQTEELCKDLKEDTTLSELQDTLEGKSLDPVPEDSSPDCSREATKEKGDVGSDSEGNDEALEETGRRKKGKQLQQEARMALIKQLAKAREARQQAEEKGEQPPLLEDFIDDSLSDICSVRSFSTTASSIDPRDVKHRTHRDLEKRQKKQVSKKNLRVKGEANAFRRIKKQNEVTARDCAGWDDF